MKEGVKESADRVLRGAVEQENGVPGVVAMATDREGNFYEGAAGSASLGTGDDHGHRVRHLLVYQGHHGRGGQATRGGG